MAQTWSRKNETDVDFDFLIFQHLFSGNYASVNIFDAQFGFHRDERWDRRKPRADAGQDPNFELVRK
jgi:hypothetical protein